MPSHLSRAAPSSLSPMCLFTCNYLLQRPTFGVLDLYERSGNISVYVTLAERFFTDPATDMWDRSTNMALTHPQFLFLGSGWDPVMDNIDKKGHCCKGRRNEYQCSGWWRDAERELIQYPGRQKERGVLISSKEWYNIRPTSISTQSPKAECSNLRVRNEMQLCISLCCLV